MELSVDQIKRIVEASLLMSREPQTAKKLAELFTPEENITERAIVDTLTLLTEDYRGRGVELVEVATGFRFQVCADLAPWIQRTMAEKPQRYSRALLETLALIAYRQPITRAEIEEIRGVVVSTQIMRTLEEREWVRVIGHRDVPGRPALYATTKQFLNDLNLKSLGELPTLAELQDLDKLDGQFQQLNLDIAPQENTQTENSENLALENRETDKPLGEASEGAISDLTDEGKADDIESNSIEEEKEDFIQELLSEEHNEAELSAVKTEEESEVHDEELMNDESGAELIARKTEEELEADNEELLSEETERNLEENEKPLSEDLEGQVYVDNEFDNEEENEAHYSEESDQNSHSEKVFNDEAEELHAQADDDEALTNEDDNESRDSDSFDEDLEELEEEDELNFESDEKAHHEESYFESEEEEYEELELTETEA